MHRKTNSSFGNTSPQMELMFFQKTHFPLIGKDFQLVEPTRHSEKFEAFKLNATNELSRSQTRILPPGETESIEIYSKLK